VERKRGERYGEKFRRQVIKRMNACDNIVKLSRKLGIHRRLLYKWRDDLEKLHRQAGSEIPILNSRETVLRRELNRFKRLLAEKTVELDFFKGALQRVEARRQRSNASGEKASTKRFEMPLQGSLSIERMCQLAQVSRAGFYRYLQGQAPVEEGMIVRSAIQEIALEHRRHYGYRRVTAELRRRGMIANHKRVARMMRADNLLATQHRKLVVEADWTEEREIHLNLARRLKTTGPNQLWIADITYIRLRKEFVYLAVILDAYSRKDVGWALDRTLRARLPLTALEQAILNREPPPGVVHHSDRGIQYASDDYELVELLLGRLRRSDGGVPRAWLESLNVTSRFMHRLAAGRHPTR
jgi:transposase-like protein